MKKKLFLALSLVLCAGSGAFAASITTSTVIGNGTFSPSTKVGIAILSAPTSYAATSAHLSGTFQYGTGGGSAYVGDASKILKKAIPSQASYTVGTPDAPTDATTIGTGWAD
jgi:hypothetical protein